MILIKPAKIFKKKLEVIVSEHDFETKKTTNKWFDPKTIEYIGLAADNSSITKGALKLLAGKNIVFLSNGTVLATINWVNEKKALEHYSKKMALLPKSRQQRLAYVFCKAVCTQRIQRLKELNKKRKLKKLKEKIVAMEKLNRQLIEVYKDSSVLKGIEGNIAKLFFSGIRELLPESSGFEQRLPENNDIYNVLLNLAHGVLRSRISKQLAASGLNDSFGFLHYQHAKNKPFLVWDFSEFWAAYLDKLCFYAVSKRIFSEKDLVKKPGKINARSGLILRKTAQERLFKLLNERINEKEIEAKAKELANYLDKKTSRFTWTT